jgi:hypothetical protein
MANNEEINVSTAYTSLIKLLKRSLEALRLYPHFNDLSEDIKNVLVLTNSLTEAILANKVRLEVASKRKLFDIFSDEEEED